MALLVIFDANDHSCHWWSIHFFRPGSIQLSVLGQYTHIGWYGHGRINLTQAGGRYGLKQNGLGQNDWWHNEQAIFFKIFLQKVVI